MPYYGIYIPTKGGAAVACAATATTITTNSNGGALNASGEGNTTESPYVFHGKSEALEVLKLHKDGRLREFNTKDDAVKYVHTGYEVVQTKYSDVRTSTASLEKAPFRGPTKQELVEFRKAIEAGDYERVKNIIWDNPRFLVSSGDTPTTLKEGCRYNAMHVCALSKKPQIAELILQTVSDIKFVNLLTGKKSSTKMCKELGANLLDYYLNIPEKGRGETPLHLAAKIGCLEVIEVLISFPECKMTKNKDGLLPKEIICTRASTTNPDLYKKIATMLDERFYVPVLRAADNAVPPQIGEPFSANNPPNLNCDPLSPEIKIQALAGPMNKEQATKFCRRWKTPPRIGSSTASPLANNPFISPMKSRTCLSTPIKAANSNTSTPTATLQRRTLFNSTPPNSPLTIRGVKEQINMLTDAYKEQNAEEDLIDKTNGNHETNNEPTTLEMHFEKEANNNEHHQHQMQQAMPSFGKNQNSMLRTALCLQTPLMKSKKDAFYTYREHYVPSPVVFDNVANDTCYAEREIFDSPSYKERHIKLTDTEKGLEVIGRELAKEQNVEWREYWDFLDAFINITSCEGLQKLENYLLQRFKQEELRKKIAKPMGSCLVALDDVCNALEKLGITKDSNTNDMRNGYATERHRAEHNSAAANFASTSTTPYTCVEKSLQVFAKRMTKTIIHNIDNVVTINDTLLSELKRLKSLICSFKEDARFVDVQFSKVHSRIGNLISIYLENSQEITAPMKLKIKGIVQNLLLTPGERREHIECVCVRINHKLDNRLEQIQPENLKTEAMCAKVWQHELNCHCQWESNLSRKTSRRNRMEARFKNLQQTKTTEKQKNQLKQLTNLESVESADELEEDEVFWSDIEGTDTDEEDDVWLTPPESPSGISLLNMSDEHSIKPYIYGNEPTKRDLDVLNAIFHVDIDKAKFPNICAWKNALLRHSNEEMDYFPSPSVIKKSQSFTIQNSLEKYKAVKTLSSPQLQLTNQSSQSLQYQLPIAKRLFMSPAARNKTPNKQTEPLRTPANKLRGLFSNYRERLDSSPMSMSSASPDTASINASADANNLSLLNISTPE